jgi:hypothetical protein
MGRDIDWVAVAVAMARPDKAARTVGLGRIDPAAGLQGITAGE